MAKLHPDPRSSDDAPSARRRERRALRRLEPAVDTVPLSAEEEEMLAASDAALARGECVTTADLRARLGLPAAR